MRPALITILGVLLISGCGTNDNPEDIQIWMDDVAKNARGKIAPLPEMKPYEPMVYDAQALVDPFNSSKLGGDKKKSGGGVQPNLERPREPLEVFPLESLSYVGSVVKKSGVSAIVRADSVLHNVKVGNYMGLNFGVVVKISDTEIILKELVQDGAGDWRERESKLQLQEQEGKK